MPFGGSGYPTAMNTYQELLATIAAREHVSTDAGFRVLVAKIEEQQRFIQHLSTRLHALETRARGSTPAR